jgi:tetratricopeptide (TPR) repeat protein
MEYSTAALKSGGRFVSAEALLRHRSEAAATVTSPRPTSVGEMLKEAGNEAFEAGRFVEAIQHYSAAIEAVSGDGAAASADTRVLLPATSDSTTTGRPCEVELLAALHSNRSAAYLQAARQWNSAEEAYGRALCDADRAVALRPSWFKGYSRQGDAYFKLRRYGTAAEAYEMALQLDPRNTTLANALAETRQRAKQSAREELELRRTLRSTGASSHMHRTRLSEERLDVQPLGGHNGGSTGYTTGGPRRSSGQAQQRWEELKHEVEATTHAPTGDAYRLQQLERFRQRGGTAAASTVSEARRSFASALKHDTTLAEWQSPPHHGPVSTSESRHTTPPTPAEAASLTTPSRPCNDRSSGGARDSSLPPTNTTAAAPATTTTNITTTSATSASLAPVPPPRRSTYESPTPGGIQAAMANFSGPVTSARDVPYEFSSAAASAYQQKLLEAFRQRKTKQP